MLRKGLIYGALAAMTIAIGAGCYVEYADDEGGGGFAGWDCEIDRDCAAGCYCSDAGYCEEAGFCDAPEDCPDGFTCDDRNSCVPDRSDAGCESSDECEIGSFCNAEGACEESAICTDQDDCDEVGGECNLDRNTCEPAPPVSECLADADCGVAPDCEVGTSAEIVEGCYTGVCIANDECTDGAPCGQIGDQEGCEGRNDCTVVVNGINCTNGAGDPCNVGDTDCSCESVEFAECRDAAPSPQPNNP